jgi:hypothetical protein
VEPFDFWEGGRVGAPPLKDEVRLQIVPYLAKELAVSPGGEMVGVLTVWGELYVVDRAGSRRCSAATGVAAIELLDAPFIGWMSEGGVWTRAPASALAWKAIGDDEFY